MIYNARFYTTSDVTDVLVLIVEPPVCSVEGFRRALGVDCDTAIVVANILGVGLFGVFMLVCLIVVKRRQVLFYSKSV